MEEWVGGLVEFRPLDAGPQLGSRALQIVDLAGRRWELQSEIVAYDPPRRLDAQLSHKAFASRASYLLEPTGGGTRLTATMESDYKQMAARLMAGVVTRQTQKKLASDLERLKRVVEAAAD